MTAPSPRLQLWKEEGAILSGFAADVPAHGTIVEIGTAEGATARLMHEATAARHVAIYTVDVAPSRIARASLEGSGVNIIGRRSEEFAKAWAAEVNRQIDFLFIDGNHDLEHVVTDWNAWAPYLKPGARVAFHDFDPPRRGGLAHFAVRICGETVRGLGKLRDPGHDYKLLHGHVADPARAAISAEDCRQTLQRIAVQVRSAMTANAASVLINDDPRLAALVGVALKGNAAAPGSIELDSLTVCYLAEQALRKDYPGLAELPSSHTDFLVWGEALQMLDHGVSGARFPFEVPDAGASLHDLSAFVAREQVRLVLLSRVVALLVDWKP